MPAATALFSAPRPLPGWKALACLAFTCLTVTSLPARGQSLDEINQLIRSGQHAKALEQANRYLAERPKDAQARFLKGIALTALNRQSEALAVFQKLTEDYPALPEPFNNLAVIYAQQKQYDKAREALEKAIRTHPAYATAHENLGDIYSRLASEAYGKALQLDASNASAQTKLAMIDSLVGGGRTAVAAPSAAGPANKPVPTQLAKAETPPVEPPKPAAVVAKPAEVKEAKPAAEPKPAEARPAPPPAAGADAAVLAEITAAVDSWLAAWSRKDVKAYLAHYAKDFQVPGGQSRKAWEAERTQRVGKPGKIEVSRDKLSIKLEGEQATVRFRQTYKSAGFNATSGKTLVMGRENGKWLIREERVGG
ncbi:MAG: tetratricopeptide repeat protein [Rhodocyclaceae bacterium]|nr:tetratricopeptide repeat protein [Rhodocyclaceae bacterium]